MRCGRRFTTYELVEERRPVVVKKDGRREPFQREKVLRGLELACRKRPVETERLSQIADEVEREVHDRGVSEIPAAVIGELVMEALRGLDAVAYVRYASVYRDFKDVAEFRELLEGLRPDGTRVPSRRRKPLPVDVPTLRIES